MPLEGLPDNLKSNETLSGFNSLGDLADAYVKSVDWKGNLPEDLRAEKSLTTFKSVGDLARSHVEAQKMIGGSIRIPKADAKPEEWDAFYAKLGRPGKPEEYGIAKPENLPEGVSWDENLAKWFAATAHSVGMPKAMAQKFMEQWNGLAAQSFEERQRQAEEALRPLREEWGKSFDGRVELGVRAVKHFGGEDLAKYLNESGLGNNPALIKTFSRIGKMLVDQGFISGDGGGGALTRESIQEKIKGIMSDKEHPYNNAKHPRHAEAMKEMSQLYEEIYPEKAS